LLLLDEPTNDLDIPTLEILEESLLDFEGALVLVTHDRYLLDRVSTIVLGLDGGRAEAFADYSQWAADTAVRKPVKSKAALPGKAAAPQKKKLSYIESREYEGIEEKIHGMEAAIQEKRVLLQEAGLKDGRILEQIYREIQAAEQEIDLLYARWTELEEKVGRVQP